MDALFTVSLVASKEDASALSDREVYGLKNTVDEFLSGYMDGDPGYGVSLKVLTVKNGNLIEVTTTSNFDPDKIQYVHVGEAF